MSDTFEKIYDDRLNNAFINNNLKYLRILKRRHPDVYEMITDIYFRDSNRDVFLFENRNTVVFSESFFDFMNEKTFFHIDDEHELISFSSKSYIEHKRRLTWLMFFEFLRYHKEKFFIRLL